MYTIKASLFGLIFSLALLQNAFAAEAAPAPPVIVSHTFNGYSTAGNTSSLNLTVHVVNPGDSALSDVTLSFVPMPPFVGQGAIDVGTLAPRQSADFPLRLEALATGFDEISHAPLFFAGKCQDAQGIVEFPAASRPKPLNKKLYLQSLQNKPSMSAAAATPLSTPPSPTASGNFLFKWGKQYPADPIGVAVDSAGNIYVADDDIDGIQVYDSSGNFMRSWGGVGTGDGQFDGITGVAVDNAGNVYVADSGNSRIQVFDKSGNFLRAWGSYGTDNDQFDGLTGIAVDSAGNVYAADRYAVRVQVFDSNGNFLRTVGSHGSGDGQYQNPVGVAVDSSGNVYVTDTYYNRVEVYDSSGNFVMTIGGNGQFGDPEGVAVDKSGNVYVADAGNNVVYAFDSSGNFVKSFGGYGSGNGGLSCPNGVAVNSSGKVYVADTNNSRVQAFTGAGTYLSTIGNRSAYGSFYHLAGVATDSGGNVYVADTGNNRIQVFDKGGKFQMAWGGYGSGEGQFEYPQGVAVDASGDVYVADGGNNRVDIFDNTGTFLRSIEGAGDYQLLNPYCLALDVNANMYVGNYNGGVFGSVYVFDKTGTFVRIEGQVSYQPIPRGVAVDANGNVYVGSAHDWGGQVMVFDGSGNFLREFGGGQVQLFGNGVAVDGSGNVYVTDDGFTQTNGRVLIFDNTGNLNATLGSEGYGDGQFHYPAGMALNTSGSIVYVGDSGNNRIEAFTGYGTNSPVTTVTVTGTAGNGGWYTSNVVISITATSPVSGIKAIHVKVDNRAMRTIPGSSVSVQLSGNGRHTVVYYAVDNAGNQEPPNTLDVNIDKAPPVITIKGVRNGAVYTLGAAKTPTNSVTDNVSGVASQNESLTGGNATGAGIFTYTVNAADGAGNTATKSASYSVRYAFSGLLPRNGKQFTDGSDVPVQFQLRDAKKNYISTASATLMLKSPDGSQVVPSSNTNAGNAFRYDSASSRYAYDLDTSGMAAGRWQLQVTLDDQSPVKTTFIKLK